MFRGIGIGVAGTRSCYGYGFGGLFAVVWWRVFSRLLVIANVDRFLHLTGAGIGTGDGEMRLWRVNCG